MTITLYSNNQRKTCYLHRLVAEAYIPNPSGLSEVNHKDEDKSHNYINNLEWINRKDNNNYGTHNERQAQKHRKPVYCVELDQIFESQTAATIALNLPKSGISHCLSGKQKTSGGYHWTYFQ